MKLHLLLLCPCSSLWSFQQGFCLTVATRIPKLEQRAEARGAAPFLLEKPHSLAQMLKDPHRDQPGAAVPMCSQRFLQGTTCVGNAEILRVVFCHIPISAAVSAYNNRRLTPRQTPPLWLSSLGKGITLLFGSFVSGGGMSSCAGDEVTLDTPEPCLTPSSGPGCSPHSCACSPLRTSHAEGTLDDSSPSLHT